MQDDTPKIWNDNIKYDPETGEILEEDTPTDIIPVE